MIIDCVMEIIRTLNPTESGLIDMEGCSSVPIGKNPRARQAKLFLADQKAYRRGSASEEILAATLPVLIRRHHGLYQLTNWFIFADGLTQFSPTGPLTEFEEAIAQARDGAIVTSVPARTWIEIAGLGRFLLNETFGGVPREDKIAEARDELQMLKGNPGAIRGCKDALDDYLRTPTPQTRERLRIAYENVPPHLRIYCGDMDSKDGPIRQILNLDAPPDLAS